MTRPNLYFEVIQAGESKDKTLLRLLCRAEAEKRHHLLRHPEKGGERLRACCMTTVLTPPPGITRGFPKPSPDSKNQEDFLYDRKHR